jgi:class 3 adenylate cyclase
MADTALATSPNSLERFLADHPWQKDQLALGTPLEFLWHFDVDARPDEIWPHLSDTSRLNRAMGVNRMHFEERDGVLYGRTRNAGVLSEWVEVPWTWVSESTLTSVRLYSRGLGHVVRATFGIEPQADGSRVSIYFGWIPRGFWQRVLLRIGMGSLEKEFARVLQEIEQHAKDARQISPFVAPPPELSPESSVRLQALEKRLREEGADADTLARLVELVQRGDDLDLYRIQILPLARRWKVDEFKLLSTCLKATRVGLLQMSWDVICPHCRGVRAEVKTLGEVPARGDCKACGIDFDTDRENSIEITFHVHPSVREVEKLFFCSAEPAKKSHIKLFQIVPPRGRLRVATRLHPGRYRLRVASEREYQLIEIQEEGTESELRWPQAASGELVRFAPAPTLVLENDDDAPKSFTLEESGWNDDALRPSQLLSFQDFRDLFTEEYLGSDVQLSVGRQTIFFSDVVGSTRLYATRGDPGAFADVKRHFTEVYDVVKKHHGAIVKTIGDAAMAAFPSPVEALRASRELQERLPPERDDLMIRVRISLNTGPCIAVNLNTNVDYFGNTVNLAAKLQACAGAGQIAFPVEVLEHPGVRELLNQENAQLEEVVFETPTVGRPMNVVRWDAFAGRPSRRFKK